MTKPKPLSQLTSTFHLTHTGMYAGQPFCTIYKPQALLEGIKFVHYAALYGVTDKELLENKYLCQSCKNILRELMTDD